MSYYDDLGISPNDYDEIIATHPLIDPCNMSIAYRLIEHIGISCEGKSVLDVGTGTGQVSRFLQGIPGLKIEACDIDARYGDYFREHPELRTIPFLCTDIIEDTLDKHYDAAIARGVYHHLPKEKRPNFLRAMCDLADVVILVDEGVLEYQSEEERVSNCNVWYNYVVNEARRRGLTKLAENELSFWKNEYKSSADDGGDFKESPSHLVADAQKVGLRPISIDKFGPWEEAKGGIFTVTFISGERNHLP